MNLFEQERRNRYSLKNKLIRFFGLKGSWIWAKKQMINGNIVRCRHWSGGLILKIDSPENTLLQACYSRTIPRKFETSNHHLSYELFTDYYIFEKSNK